MMPDAAEGLQLLDTFRLETYIDIAIVGRA
jgi:hypothetical protein